MEKQRTCIAYLRVSTMMQVNAGISLETQERAIEMWALQHNYRVRATERDEGLSGTTLKKRVGLQKALDMIQPGEALVVYSLSRLARSVSDTVKLVEKLKKEKKADLASATEPIDTVTSAGQLMLNLFATFAQFEAQITAERVRACLREKIRKKEWVGRPPIGWKAKGGDSSGIVENSDEQKIVELVKAERNKRDKNFRLQSYEKVAEVLNSSGVPPPRNCAKWYKTQVYRICNRGELDNTGGRTQRKRRGKNTNSANTTNSTNSTNSTSATVKKSNRDISSVDTDKEGIDNEIEADVVAEIEKELEKQDVERLVDN